MGQEAQERWTKRAMRRLGALSYAWRWSLTQPNPEYQRDMDLLIGPFGFFLLACLIYWWGVGNPIAAIMVSLVAAIYWVGSTEPLAWGTLVTYGFVGAATWFPVGCRNARRRGVSIWTGAPRSALPH